MGFSRFSFSIGIRTALIMFNLLVLTYLLLNPGYHAASVAATLVLVAQCYGIVKFVSTTNGELVRFFEAAKNADYSQRFDLSRLGSGFVELGNEFSAILSNFQHARQQREEQLKHLKAVIEHVPVPLISIQQDGMITLWNNSARRLFGVSRILRIDDLSQFGTEFEHQLTTIKAGERRLVDFKVDGMTHQLSLSMTDVHVAGRREKLLSLQDIQNELDASQMKAWQELVRVLTHEIMNSITPVASLAATAVDLIDDTKNKVSGQPDVMEALNDVSSAVETVARRSDGLINFVSSYRKLTSLPKLNKQRFKIKEKFDHVQQISMQNTESHSINYKVNVVPSELELFADQDMLEQILINLVKNAQQALVKSEHPQIELNAYLNRRGHAVLEVSDNGVGIAEDITNKIFIPFFTTKKNGSGVGLALARQIMNGHDGSIHVTPNESGGVTFRLIF